MKIFLILWGEVGMGYEKEWKVQLTDKKTAGRKEGKQGEETRKWAESWK
jgi:hypothetical protein